MRHLPCLLALILTCWLISACTLGPITESRVLVVRPGQPVEILENVKVMGRRLDNSETITVDVGGWVTMPREHFDALIRAVKGSKP